MNTKEKMIVIGDRVEAFIAHPATIMGFIFSIPWGFKVAGEPATNVYISIVTALILFITAANSRTNDLALQKKLDKMLEELNHEEAEGIESQTEEEIKQV